MPRRTRIDPRSIFPAHIGKLGQPHKHSPEQRQRPEHKIRRNYAHRLCVQISLVSPGGPHRRCLRVSQLHAGKNKDRPKQSRRNRAQRVKRLRKIQPPLARPRRPQLRNEWIRRRLKKRQPASNHEQRGQKKHVQVRLRRRPEHQAPRSQQALAPSDPGLVSKPPHQLRPQESPAENIPGKMPDLHQPRRIRPINVERLHELANQNVVEIVRNRPKKKQRGDYQKWHQPPRRNQRCFKVVPQPSSARPNRPRRNAQTSPLNLFTNWL